MISFLQIFNQSVVFVYVHDKMKPGGIRNLWFKSYILTWANLIWRQLMLKVLQFNETRIDAIDNDELFSFFIPDYILYRKDMKRKGSAAIVCDNQHADNIPIGEN